MRRLERRKKEVCPRCLLLPSPDSPAFSAENKIFEKTLIKKKKIKSAPIRDIKKRYFLFAEWFLNSFTKFLHVFYHSLVIYSIMLYNKDNVTWYLGKLQEDMRERRKLSQLWILSKSEEFFFFLIWPWYFSKKKKTIR